MLTRNAEQKATSFALVFVSLMLIAAVFCLLAFWFSVNPLYLEQVVSCQNNPSLTPAACTDIVTQVGVWRVQTFLGMR